MDLRVALKQKQRAEEDLLAGLRELVPLVEGMPEALAQARDALGPRPYGTLAMVAHDHMLWAKTVGILVMALKAKQRGGV